MMPQWTRPWNCRKHPKGSSEQGAEISLQRAVFEMEISQ